MSDAKKILVVDDDPDTTDQLSVILKGSGYDVVVANSQEEAENAVMGVRPDLAIVDVMMEHSDSGFVLCHELKRLFPELPVAILTSVKAATDLSFAPENADEKSWVKADCVLDKPVRPERLRNEVRRLLGQPAAAAKH